ncbi:MAG: bifunctional folylpolyglutamate synthase/dihydrofolate synthase [Filifactoraceae bacterium]
MNYYEALNFVNGTNIFGSKLGLENINRLLTVLGNPHKDLKVIHVAGTNGKGSTCKLLSNILTKAGYRTGLYISPSLEEINDRISIDNENISDEMFCELAGEVKHAIEKLLDEGYEHPTEFEVVTSMAFLYYKRSKVDYVVLEVGLGGRLDATNVCNPVATAITSISLDHTEYLGDTLEEIAVEKAGIIKDGVPVVIYDQKKSVVDAIKNIANSKDASIYINSEVFCNLISQNVDSQIVELKYKENILNLRSTLVGGHQVNNIKTVIKILEVLEVVEGIFIGENAVKEGIETVRWAGRFEYIEYSPKIVLDGAHNVDGAQALRNTIEKTIMDKHKTLVFGMLRDKDIESVVKIFGGIFQKVILTRPNSTRAEEPKNIQNEFKRHGVESVVEIDIDKAINLGLSYDTDVVIVAGSLYLIGDVRKYLREKGIIK